MRDERVRTFRMITASGALVVFGGVALLLSSSGEWMRLTGAVLTVIGALMIVFALVRLRRTRL